jgi:acetoin utilization protein AcuB
MKAGNDMKVKAIMTPASKLVLLSPSDTAKNAIQEINNKGILSLPVVDNKNFVGFLSKQFVYETFFQEGNSDIDSFLKRPISGFLHNRIEPIHSDLPIEQAAKIFFENNVRFIPVVNELNEFQGIVTQKVIFGLLTKIYGLEDPKISVILNDVKGMLSRIAEIINRNGGNIKNVVLLDTSVKGVTEMSIRLTAKDINRIRVKLKENGFQLGE